MTNLMLADFHGLPIHIVDHAGKKWLTAEQIGLALGYDQSNARKGVLKIYERHGDEFTEADTCVVNLTTQGQARATRIYSETGCIKLCFFASTPRAKEFRTWASRILAGQTAVPPIPAAPRYPALPGRVTVTRALERQVLERFAAGLSQKAIAKELGLSAPTVNLLLHAKYQFSPWAGAPECGPELIAAVAARHLAVEQGRLAEAQQRIAQKLLASAHNQPLAEALDIVGRMLLPQGGEE